MPLLTVDVDAPDESEGVEAAGETSAERTDAALMARVQHDDTAAFAVLYERYAGRMRSLAARICGPDAAEDVAQVAFASVWIQRDRYCPELGNVSGWLFMYTRQRAIDAARRENSRNARAAASAGRAKLALDSALARDGTYSLVTAREESAGLVGQLRKLPLAQQHVIELAYFGGLTHREIARRLELPVGTVKGRLRLGLAKLRAGHRSSPVAL